MEDWKNGRFRRKNLTCRNADFVVLLLTNIFDQGNHARTYTTAEVQTHIGGALHGALYSIF